MTAIAGKPHAHSASDSTRIHDALFTRSGLHRAPEGEA